MTNQNKNPVFSATSSSQNNDSLRKIIEKELDLFFKKLGFKIKDHKISFGEVDLDKNKFLIKINLTIDNPEMLIGEKGDTLTKVQHILRIILRKKIFFLERSLERSSSFYLDLDIDNYKEKRGKYLEKIAKEAAQEVVLSGKEKLLEIMPSYERRIIHLALKDNDKVLTESTKEGRDKRIIIKPKVL